MKTIRYLIARFLVWLGLRIAWLGFVIKVGKDQADEWLDVVW